MLIQNPDIESKIDNIYFPKTRGYIKEVMLSFYAESYRSAIVMLYSITIADLVMKLAELEQAKQDEIKGCINERYDLGDIALFLSNNPKQFILEHTDIEDTNWKVLASYANHCYDKEFFLDLCVKRFSESNSFTDADINYNICVGPHLDSFSAEQLDKILSAANSNSQIWCCYKVQSKLKVIAAKLVSLKGDYDFGKLENIKNYLGLAD